MRKASEEPAGHHPECELFGYGVCTCGYWRAMDAHTEAGTSVTLYGVEHPARSDKSEEYFAKFPIRKTEGENI